MNRFLLGVLALLCAAPLGAQELWSDVLSANRAIDWASTAGIPGGIPVRSTNCTTAACNTLWNGGSPGNVTVSNINSAISSAGTNEVVRIPAGTHNINGLISVTRSNVVLRGQGASSTKLVASGGTLGIWVGCDTCNWSDGPANVTNMTGAGNPPSAGTYVKGATQILVASVANLSVGDFLVMDQTDPGSDTGNIWICSASSAACSAEGGSSLDGGRGGGVRGQQQWARVTAINEGGCGSTCVTIDPPLIAPNWTSGQSPQIWHSDTQVSYIGFEDFTISAEPAGAPFSQVVGIYNAHYVWLLGVAIIKDQSPGQARDAITMRWASNNVIKDSYIRGGPAAGNSDGSLSYGFEPAQSGNHLVENTIFHGGVTPALIGISAGNVLAYNFFVDQIAYDATCGASDIDCWMYPTIMEHHAGSMYNLYEGNDGWLAMSDQIHGTHAMSTWFRNRFSGYDLYTATQTAQTVPIIIQARSRYQNIIGNVLGRSGYHTGYQNNVNGGSASCDRAIYNLGWGATGCANGTPTTGGSNGDTLTVTSAMRWGNYDVVTGAVRWCGNSGSTGWSTTCSSTSEVPTGEATYPNTVPAAESLPASFYLSARPDAWWGTPWGTPAWPPVGPDVNGGNISEGSGGEAGLDGHAHKIPARLCFENTGQTGGILNFNRASCYQSATVLPGPGNFRIR